MRALRFHQALTGAVRRARRAPRPPRAKALADGAGAALTGAVPPAMQARMWRVIDALFAGSDLLSEIERAILWGLTERPMDSWCVGCVGMLARLRYTQIMRAEQAATSAARSEA